MSAQGQSYRSDEVTLVRKAARGDLDAFNELVLAYQDMAYNYAYSLLGDPDAADDATQESFIKAFQALGGLRGDSFRSWLLRIVANSAYDILRKARRHPAQPLFPQDESGEEIESPAWLADPSALVQEVVEQKELSNSLYKAFDELPDVYRSVITLVDLYELDYIEAAKTLKIPIGTVKSRIARARMHLKKKLKGCLGEHKTVTGANPCLAL